MKRYSKCTLLLSTDRGSNAISEALGLAVLRLFVEVGSVQATVMGSGRGWKLIRRPSEYQGPSWSWTSINSSVTFVSCEPSHTVDKDFSVAGVHIQPVNSGLDKYYARFGAMESGKLILRGKLKPAIRIKPRELAKTSQ